MGVFKSFPIAIRMITRDPVNLVLALIPTLIAVAVYAFVVITILNNTDYIGIYLQNHLPDQKIAGWVGKLLTVILIIFVFLIASWTFVLIVGIISAPFNSMLSSRIEAKLAGRPVTADKSKTFMEIFKGIGNTFKNELKKMVFLILLSVLAFVFQIFPLFYPLGLLTLALVLALQFVDYSWSRHEYHFGNCLGDTAKNLVPYVASGFVFLILITVPIINVMVPALATSYYTVLWLHRQNRILPQT